MKAATLAVRKILQESTEVRATPKLRVEFEHNRYSKIKPVNDKGLLVSVSPPNDQNDNEWNGIFDANAITLPSRPGTGIAKARLSDPIKLSVGIKDKPQSARFYAASSEDVYRYWSHSARSAATPVATNDYNLPNPVKVAIMYEDKLISNKVTVGFETSYASPKSYDIQITTVPTPAENQWTTIGSNVTPDAKGEVSLWLKNDGSNTWSTTPVYDSLGWVHGVRLVARSVTKGRAYLDVIQLGARLERDISDLVIDYSKEFEISDRSFIAPLGAASSNQASVTLSNFDQTFDGDREFLDTAQTIINPFYGLIDKKAKLTLDLSIDATSDGGSLDERIREFTMWVDSWGGQDEDSVTVTLKDSSIFLQEVDMPKTFWEKMTVGAIIWQIMDTVGLTNYNYNHDPLDTGQEIPYFWSNQGTAWEQIAALTEATQTAVYFDEYDVMQIRTRQSIFGGNKAVDWNLDAVQNGPKLPEVISASTDDSLVVNHVDINYKPAEFKTNKGVDQMETVWEPKDETVTLRAAGILRDLPASGGDIYITSAQAAYWPYESYVNIRGEIIKYSGKEYLRYKKGGGTEIKIIHSLEEKQALDEDVTSDLNLAWANNFTGRLIVTERGVSNSGVATHKLRQTDYSASIVTTVDGNFLENRSNWHHQKDGFVQLSIPPGTGNHMIYAMRPNATVPTSNTTYGARVRFASNQIRSDGWAVGGLHFASDWGDVGYYLEIMTTKTSDELHGRLTNEINLWIGGAGSNPLGRATSGVPAMGVAANIIYDRWYDLEVKYQHQVDGSANIIVYLDGMFMTGYNIQPNQRWPEGGTFGAYARGACTMDVDYLYAVWDDPSGPAGTVTPDGSTWLDLAKGSYTSGYIEREWRFNAYLETGVAALGEGGRRLTSFGNRGFYYYDEFGPVVHEMREFNIEFEEDDVPVAHSFLYLSNTQVHCTDYTSNAFGAKFTLVNASRQDAIIKGEDAVTFGIDNKVEQKMFIYGQKLFQEEENIITKTDDQSIRAKGKVSLSFDNSFIQTKKMAEELGEWVVDLWGMGADEVSAEIFGNPLFQLGDLVTLNYPAKGMLPTTHKFYIVSLKNEYSEGLTTSLILRRAK